MCIYGLFRILICMLKLVKLDGPYLVFFVKRKLLAIFNNSLNVLLLCSQKYINYVERRVHNK